MQNQCNSWKAICIGGLPHKTESEGWVGRRRAEIPLCCGQRKSVQLATKQDLEFLNKIPTLCSQGSCSLPGESTWRRVVSKACGDHSHLSLPVTTTKFSSYLPEMSTRFCQVPQSSTVITELLLLTVCLNNAWNSHIHRCWGYRDILFIYIREDTDLS